VSDAQWTVPQLAALSGFSRAAFARNLEQALGQSPMRYLTEWRMTLARDHLRMDELSITEIAQRVGSPNAFAAAFQRHHGHPPGRWRDGQRDKTERLPALLGHRHFREHAVAPPGHCTRRATYGILILKVPTGILAMSSSACISGPVA
jgi:AraC-like DNA-binding protein